MLARRTVAIVAFRQRLRTPKNVREMSVPGQEDAGMDTIQRLADATEREDVERYVRNRSFLFEVSDAIRRADAVRRLELALQRRAA